MKKKYEKPQIFYESFQLSEHIAGNCNVIMNQGDDSCTVGSLKPGSITGIEGIFTLGGENCTFGQPEDDYCYWNGSSVFKGFAS